ncbi:MAG: four helix bundle protein [Cyclobacteriaceae bacterium]
MRSATSVAANYRADCTARSLKEFYAKLCIVVEEADETLFWLELLHESGMVSHAAVRDIQAEAKEILTIVSKARSTSKRSKYYIKS